jgi:hypothetical protein
MPSLRSYLSIQSGQQKKNIHAAKADLMVIDKPEQEPAYDWMSPIVAFLDNQPPSDDNSKVERIMRKSKTYRLID